MKKIDEYTSVELKNLSKSDVLNLIRGKLRFDRELSWQLHNYSPDMDFHKEEHRRFEMSGYDGFKRGSCTIHNMNILNEFASIGIYDYTEFLFLDFYKGTPTVYLKYWNGEYIEDDFGGLTTSEIIYEIFKLTIFKCNELTPRRRD